MKSIKEDATKRKGPGDRKKRTGKNVECFSSSGKAGI